MFSKIPCLYEKHDVCLMCLCVDYTCQCFNLRWSSGNLAHGRTCTVAKGDDKACTLNLRNNYQSWEKKKSSRLSPLLSPRPCKDGEREKKRTVNADAYARFSCIVSLSQRNLRRFNCLKQSSRPHDCHTASAHVDTSKCNTRWLEMDCHWTRAMLDKPESSRQGCTTGVYVTLF